LKKEDKTKLSLKFGKAGKASGKRDHAWAPYNFIQLNDVVVEAQFQQPDQLPVFDKYCNYDRERNEGYLTGEIGYELETIAPLYIRGMAPEKSGGKNGNPDFFAPGKKVKIPGSSIRGMVRNLVEIVSWGKFENFEDRKLFYRMVGDKSELGENYRATMLNQHDHYSVKVKAGLLKKVGLNYIILPSSPPASHPGFPAIYRVRYDPESRKVAGTDIELREFEYKKIFFKPVREELHTHYRRLRDGRKIPFKLKYAKVQDISLAQQNGFCEGYLISSGNLGAKKHMHWIITLPDAKNSLTIPDEVVQSYTDDKNRMEQADLLEMLKKDPAGVPCFYLSEQINNQEKVIAFGHTGLFRLPHKHSIGYFRPSSLKDKTGVIDLAEAIFGVETKFASRVSFEDALPREGQDDLLQQPEHPKILASPKPTTFQHYLNQPKGVVTPVKELSHWSSDDSKTCLRGYKYYWYRDTQDEKDPNYWVEQPEKISETRHTRIQPIRPRVKFEGKIRFINLSPVEIGALLFVLNLPENHYHKLGMGKPLGLGSVKITPKLVLSDRKKRYTTLFDETTWAVADTGEPPETYIDKFEQYVLAKLKELGSREAGAKKLWNTERLKNLKTMLDWKNTERKGWLEATRYMEIERYNPDSGKKENEYNDRPVLPEAIRVVESLDKN